VEKLSRGRAGATRNRGCGNLCDRRLREYGTRLRPRGHCGSRLIGLPNRMIGCYRSPRPAGYADVVRLGKTHTMISAAVPELAFTIDQIIG